MAFLFGGNLDREQLERHVQGLEAHCRYLMSCLEEEMRLRSDLEWLNDVQHKYEVDRPEKRCVLN